MLKQFYPYIHKLLIDDSAGMFERWIRHLIAGGSGTVLYIGMIAFFVEITDMHPVRATAISFIFIMSYIYILNRIWVYNTTGRHSRTVIRYITVASISFILNTGIMYIVVEQLEAWYGFGIIAAALIVPLTNFLLNYFWAFK